MEKYKMSYAMYNTLCEKFSDSEAEDDVNECDIPRFKLPTSKQILEMTGSILSYFMLVCIMLSEHQWGKLSSKDKEKLTLLNRSLIKNIEFVENEPEDKGHYAIPYDSYIEVCNLIDQMEIFPENWIPSTKFMEEFLLPNMRYGFGLALYFYRKGNRKKKEVREMKAAIKKTYTLTTIGKEITISQKEYEYLKSQSERIYDIEEHNFWPSMEDIQRYIIPNFSICYDYVLWLFIVNRKPQSKEEIESYKVLKNLVSQKVCILKGERESWL